MLLAYPVRDLLRYVQRTWHNENIFLVGAKSYDSCSKAQPADHIVENKLTLIKVDTVIFLESFLNKSECLFHDIEVKVISLVVRCMSSILGYKINTIKQ